MHFQTRDGKKYLSLDGKSLTENKSEAMIIEVESISIINPVAWLVRFRCGNKYLSCLDKDPLWIDTKEDSTIFMFATGNKSGFYISVKNCYLSLNSKGLISSSFIDIHDDKVGINNCGYSPNLILSS